MTNMKRLERYISLLMIMILIVSYSEPFAGRYTGAAYGAAEQQEEKAQAQKTEQNGSGAQEQQSGVSEGGEQSGGSGSGSGSGGASGEKSGGSQGDPGDQNRDAASGKEGSGSKEEKNKADKKDQAVSGADKGGRPEAKAEKKDSRLKYHELDVLVSEDPYYEEMKGGKNAGEIQQTSAFSYFGRFWHSLTGREEQPPEEELKKRASRKAPVKVTVKAEAPEDITALVDYIEIDDTEADGEKGLFALEIFLVDKKGEIYVPGKGQKVDVSVEGEELKSEIAKDDPIAAYIYEESAERRKEYTEKYKSVLARSGDKEFYAANVLVYQSKGFDDARRMYEQYDSRKKYADGSDAVRFAEAGSSLSTAGSTVSFAYDHSVLAGSDGINAEAGEASTIKVVLTAQQKKAEDKKQEEAEKAEKKDGGSKEKAAEKENKEDKDKKDKEKEAGEAEKKVPVKGQVLTAGDGRTFEVTVSYGRSAGIPEDAELKVTDAAGDFAGCAEYRSRSAKALGIDAGSLDFMRALDIKLIDPKTGEEYQPEKDVRVSVRLLGEDLDSADEISVVHFSGEDETGRSLPLENAPTFGLTKLTTGGAAGGQKAEILGSRAGGDAVEFTTGGFSVFVIAGYTVDFHWGEYTYNLAGGSEIFLSELLVTLAENAGESAEETARLEELSGDLSKVQNVHFSDPEFVKVEQKSSKHDENDWLLTSLAAFDTEETLTIRLVNGEEFVIRVTDAQRSNDAEGTFKVIERSNGNSSQQTITYWDTFAEAAAKVNSGVNYPATIEILDLKGNGSYEIDSTVSFTKGYELTIIGNGHTLSRKDGFAGTLISRTVAGAFTISDLTIDNGTTVADGSMISKAGAAAIKLNTVTINGGKGTGSLITISAGPAEMNTVTINRNDSVGIGINNTGAGDLTLNNCIVDGSNNTEATGSLIKMGAGALSLTNTAISAHTVSADGVCAVDSSASNGAADIKIYSSVRIIGNTSGGKPANLKINGTNRMYVYNDLTQDIGITSADKYQNGDQFGYMGNANITGIEHLKNDRYSMLVVEADGRYFKWAPDPSADNLDVMFGFPDVTIDDLKTYPSAEDLAIVPEGALPGANNEVQTNPYMVWKSVKYNDDNTTDITLNYYEKQVGMKLDFIFVIDETGTMHDNKTANGYKQSQAMWARYAALEASKGVLELNNTYPKSIYGTDNRVRYISFADNNFHDTGFMNNYDTALASIGYDFSGSSTYHSVAINAAANACSESRRNGHEPIVVYLSDYQAHFRIGTESSGNTYIKPSEMQALQNTAEAIYAFLVYETHSNTIADRMSLMTPLHYWMADKDDPSTLITPFVEIVHDAVARCGKTTNIQDTLANGLIPAAASNTVSSSGSPATNDVTNTGGVEAWNLLNGTTGDNRLYTGTMYTKVIHIPMKDDVYAGGMPTNQNLKLYDNGEVKNSITDSPILKSPVTLLLKGTDTSGSALSGATFKLTRGAKTWNLTTDENGKIVLPWGENDTVGATTAESTFAFPVGAEYTLTQNTTVSGFVRPAGSWTLRVGNDYKITATAAQGSGDVNRTRDLEAHAGKFEIYNDASPKVIYHYNQPSGTQTTHEDDQIEFAKAALARSYTLGGVYNTQVPGYVFAGWAISASATAAEFQEGDEITIFAKGAGTEPDPVDLYAVWAEEGDLVPLVIEKKWDGSIDWTKEPYASQKAENDTITFKVYGKTDPTDSGTLITAYTTAAGTTPVSTISATDSEGSASEWAKKIFVPRSITENGVEIAFTSYHIEETDLKIAEGASGSWAEPTEEYKEGIDQYVEKTMDQLPSGVKIYQPSSINGVNLDLRLTGAGSIRNITSVTIEYTVNNGQYYFQTKALFSRPKKLESSFMGTWEHIYRLKLLTNANGYKPVFRKLYINDVEQQVGPGNWISSAVIDTGGNSTPLWTGEDLDVSGNDSTVSYYIHEIQDRKLSMTNSFMLTDSIARVSNDDGATWKYFDALITSNYDGEDMEGAFDYASTLTGNVIIETLKETHDRYTLGKGTTFNKAANIILRTTQDDAWNPETGEGEETKRFTTTLYRGYNGGNLFTVDNAKTTLTVEHITIDGDKDGTLTGAARTGRGILQNKGTLKILDGVTMQNFKDTIGGAVNVTTDATYTTIENSSFKNCECTSNNSSEGGGALQLNVPCSVTGSTFVDCLSEGYGGAIFTKKSNGTRIVIDGCTFIGHDKLNPQTYNAKNEGGAVYIWDGSPVVTNSIFKDCTAGGDGGAFNMDGGGGETFTIDNCKFYGHVNLDPSIKNSGTQGGGLWINCNGTKKLSNLEFYDCTSNGNGGGVYSEDEGAILSGKFICIKCRSENGAGGGLSLPNPSGEMVDSEFTNCYAKSHGGGAYLTGGVTVKNSTITDCRSKEGYGGGMCVGAAGKTNTFNGCTFIGHDELDDETINATYGGAIYVTTANNSALTLSNTTFDKYSVSKDGGAIYIDNAGALTVNNGSFTDCKAGTGRAGGVIYTKSKTVSVSDCSFIAGKTENDTVQTVKNGGAIYHNNEKGSLSLTGINFYGFQSTGDGGAIYHNGSGALIVDDVRFTKSKGGAGNNGGVIYTKSAEATLEDSTFYAGAAATDTVQTAKLGGAVYQENAGGKISLIRTDIYGYQATASGGQGGAVWSNALELNMDTVNIQNNKAQDNGGGIYSAARTVGIRNTLNVTNNSLTSTSLTAAEKNHAAGIFFIPEDTIITVTSDTDTGDVYIYGNQLSNGRESNLKMGVGAPAIEINGLKANGGLTGKIGVVNPAEIDRWFGRSTSSKVCGNATVDHSPDGWEVVLFKDDTNTYFAKYQGSMNRRLIWAPLPGDVICKITDQNGVLLKYDYGDGPENAVFGSLSEAFGALGDFVVAEHPDEVFDGTPAYVKMLEKGDDYKLSKIIYVPDGLPITLTTADPADTDGYPGPADGIATVTRKNFYGSMFVMRGYGSKISTFTVENIVLDGGGSGYKNDIFNQNGGIIRADGEGCSLTLSSGAELRNSFINKHNGGAVYMANGGSFTMTDAAIKGCSSVNGGAVYLAGSSHPTAKVKNSAIKDCSASSNGGFVYSDAEKLDVEGSEFVWSTPKENMTGSNGGMIFVSSQGRDLTVTDSVFTNFRAGSSGGAIFSDAVGTVNITDCAFSRTQHNYRGAANGGAIFMNKSGSVLNITEQNSQVSTFTSIRAGSSGGAIYANKGVTVNLTGRGSDVPMFDRCFQADSGDANRGGAVFMNENGILNIKDLKISDCHAGYEIKNDDFSGRAYYTGRGGGIALAKNAAATLDNVTITGCSAYMGGAIYSEGANANAVTLKNDTSITDNKLNPNAGTRNHAAGVYMVNNGVLTIGAADITEDGTAISGNTTATGETSNLRLSSESTATDADNKDNSMSVLSTLTGEIHVVNPGSAGDIFGSTDQDAAGTNDIASHIYSDLPNHFTDTERTDNKLVWKAGDPVWKITDAAGNTLTYNGSDAVFVTLRGAFDAFPSIIDAKNIELFRPTFTETGYEHTGVYKMETGITYPNKAMDATLKTAAETAPDNKYLYIPEHDGDSWQRAKILRGNTARASSMFNLSYANNKLSLTEIILDGQWDKSQFTSSNGGTVLLGNVKATFAMLDNSAIQHSRTTASGGAVYVSANATLEIKPSANTEARFEDCEAVSGGGVYSAPDFIMNNNAGNVIFKDCYASNGHGGGVYAIRTFEANNNRSSITFDGCHTSGGNKDGGAIYSTSVFKIEDNRGIVSFRNCYTNGSDSEGGAVLAYTAFTLKNTGSGTATFENCYTKTSSTGGAIFAYTSTPTVTIEGTAANPVTFTGCHATGKGGGAIWQNANAVMTLTNVNFGGYVTDDNGKVIKYKTNEDGSFAKDGSGNYIVDADGAPMVDPAKACYSAGQGGAVRAVGALTYTNTTGGEVGFYGSKTTSGAGGGIYGASTVTLVNGDANCSTVFMSCSAIGDGGAIYSESKLSMDNNPGVFMFDTCETFGNQNEGGAIYANGVFSALDNTGTLRFDTCRTGTDTTGSYSSEGGAIFYTKDFTISNKDDGQTSFVDCTANGSDGGGAICGWDGDNNALSITGTASHPVLFENCKNTCGNGGSIYVNKGYFAALEYVTFNECSALGSSKNGGALYVKKVPAATKFTHLMFDGNTAIGYGGSIYLASDLTMEDTIIQNGKALKGSAIYVENNKTLNLNGGWASGDNAKAGISIGKNTSTNKGGGAINVGGSGAKLIFDGNVVVHNNRNSADSNKPHNVVLDVNSSNGNRTTAPPNVIRTTDRGIGSAAMIGIYATDTNPYKYHGKADQNFGHFGTKQKSAITDTSVFDYLMLFVNDRSNLTGTINLEGNMPYLCWSVGYVCKLTDDDGNILYRDSLAHKPAVFKSLKEGMEWACAPENKHAIYTSSKELYDWTDPIQLKLLVDVVLETGDTPSFRNAARKLTITTAEAEDAAVDDYPYLSERVNHNNIALISTNADKKLKDSMFIISNTRSYDVLDHYEDVYEDVPVIDPDTGEPMLDPETNEPITERIKTGEKPIYTTETDTKPVIVSKLILDGLYQNCSENGGAFRINAADSLTMKDVTFQNLKGRYGGAVYIANDIEMKTEGNVTFKDCSSTYGGTAGEPGGGAINAHGNLKLTNNGTLDFDTCIANGQGGAINVYVNGSKDYKHTCEIINTGTITFKNCSAASDGGALGVQQNHLSIDNSGNISFTDCTNNSEEGGAINIDSGILTVKNAANAELSFTRCKASHNTAGQGGAIYAGALMAEENAGKITIDSCESGYAGGAIYLNKTEEPGGQGNLVVVAGVENGFSIKNCKTGGSGGTGRNGGAIYVNGNSSITATAKNAVRIMGNEAAYAGGAIHVPDGVSMTLNGGDNGIGISVTGNRSNADSGGAINVGGTGSRLNFGGNVWIYDNLDANNAQKNVVLAHDSNAVINTTADGLGESALIGIYAVGANNSSTVFGKHGQYQQDFGTIGSETQEGVTRKGDKNLNRFTNDRNGLYGEACPVSGHESLIRWQSYLCKLTTVDVDANGTATENDRKLLYYKDAGGRLWPAVYDCLKTQTADPKPVGGFNAAQGELFAADGTEYSGTAVRVEMLKDYIQPSTDQPAVSGTRSVTFQTSQTEPTSSDVFIYNKVDSSSLDATATITRDPQATTGSMFTVNNASLSLTTTDLVFDGNLVSTTSVNGGIVKVDSGTLKVNEKTVMRKSIAANGGAVYLNTGSLVATGGNTDTTRVYITDCRATGNGGAIYDGHTANTAIDTVKLQNVTIDGHGGGLANQTVNAQYGGAIYILKAQSGNSQMGGSARLKDCMILDCTVSERGGAIYSESLRRIPKENEESGDGHEPTIHLLHTIIDGHDSLPHVITVDGTTKKLYNAQRGGAILLANGTLEMEADASGNSEIRKCTVSQYGGAIDSYGSGTQYKNSTLDGKPGDYTVKLKNTTIKDCSAGVDGGGINIRAILTLLDSTITGCSAVGNGGAIRTYGGWDKETDKPKTTTDSSVINMNVKTSVTYHNSTIADNTAGTAGAGIYLLEGAKLNLAGSPAFSTGTGNDIKTNIVGTGANAKRQDIYIAGYLGVKGGTGDDKDDPKLAGSLIVTGPLDLAKCSVWVGAEVKENEENNHWDTLKQFAKFHSELMTGSGDNMKIDPAKLSDAEVEKIYAAFRNATTSEEYYGMSGDGQKGGVQCIYWEGVTGSRKVILRKVDGNNVPLSGREFAISRSQAKPADAREYDLTSLSSGVFFVGMMDYGTYYIHEKDPEKTYKIIINDDGVCEEQTKDGKTVLVPVSRIE